MLARKNIQNAQRAQRIQYDKKAHDTKISAGDLAMLKVEPRFSSRTEVSKDPTEFKM